MPLIVGNTLVLIEEHEVDARLLAVFDSTRDDLLTIAHAAIAAKNDSVPDDPVNAAGLLGYIYGTRGVRTHFRPKGYLIDRTDNIESVVHPKKRTRVIYQNTETAADPFHHPKAISAKGSATERMIEQAYLFPEMEEERKAKIAEAKSRENQTIWYLCVAGDESGISAEISRPSKIDNHQFDDFIERIILMPGPDMPPAASKLPVDLSEQEYEINVSRK